MVVATSWIAGVVKSKEGGSEEFRTSGALEAGDNNRRKTEEERGIRGIEEDRKGRGLGLFEDWVMSSQQHRASRCVFVGNIPYDATEEQLVQICEEVGPVVSFRLVVDRDTGKPKGYGFCEFRDDETALSARRNLQGYEINGRQLRVDFAENEKGGGGVDRNRDQQGRGGPGFQQQSGSHLDGQKQGGGGGPQSGYSNVGHNPFEQPIGRQAASNAAMVMAGALGATQQVPNVMMQGQGPMQGLNVPQVPIAGNGGLAAGTDALTNHLAGMSKQQLYAIMSEMKVLIQQDQMQARQILVANPQLTKALFQAQIMLGMVRPQQGVASQPPQTQLLLPPQQPVMQQQQLPPARPPQPHPPPLALMQPQPTTKTNFQPSMLPSQQQQQQQQQQQTQAPPSQQQQQQLPPPPPQGSFQGGMVQTSMGMGFQQGPPPPPPNQLPPQQIYQMGSNMMGANLPRMGANNNGATVGQGNGGILAGGGTMGATGTGQMARGPALSGGQGGMDSRGIQLNHGLPSSTGAMTGISGVPGQVPIQVPGSMSSGHSLVSGNGGGMGQSLPGNLSGGQLMGDPNNNIGYGGLNTGMNAQMNSGMNQGNAGLNAGMNPGMNTNLNSGLNSGMPQGLIQGFNAAGMNPAMNTGLQSSMNAGMNTGMNPGMTMGLNAPQAGGFSGTTDGTSVTSAALQPQAYNQLQPAPAPQQPQGQVPLELEQQKALLQQVMNLTTEQIMSLPPDQRQQVLQLQQALR